MDGEKGLCPRFFTQVVHAHWVVKAKLEEFGVWKTAALSVKTGRKLKLAPTVLTGENITSNLLSDFNWKLWVKLLDNGVSFTHVGDKDVPLVRPRADATFGKKMALNHQERQQGAEAQRMDSGASLPECEHPLCPWLCHTGQIHLQGPQFPPP